MVCHADPNPRREARKRRKQNDLVVLIMITLSSCKYYEKSQTVELLYSTEYNQGPLIGHNKAINDREDSYWSPIKRLKAVL